MKLNSHIFVKFINTLQHQGNELQYKIENTILHNPNSTTIINKYHNNSYNSSN